MLIAILASGPDKGRVYELSDDAPVTLGRTTGPIQFSDTKISREHAHLWCEGGQWFVRDLSSRHGTFRNNKPVGDKTPLKDGDRVQLGRTVLVISRVPVEQAERLALIGKAAAEPMAPVFDREQDARRGPWRWSTFFGAAALAAALGMIVLNVVFFLDAQQRTENLRQQLLAQSQTHGSLAGSIDTEQLLDAIRTALRDESERSVELLEQVAAQLKQLPTHREAEAVLAEILETVRARPTQEQLAVTVRDAMREGAASHENLMGELFAAVQAQPQQTRAMLEEALASADPDANAPVMQTLRDVLASVDAQPARVDDLVQQRLDAFAQREPQPHPLLHELLAEVRAQPDRIESNLQQRFEALAQEQTSRDELMRQLLAVVQAQPQQFAGLLDQAVDRLAAAESGEPAGPDPLIAELAEAVQTESQRSQQRFEQMLARMDLQREQNQQQLMQQVLEAVQSQPARTEALVAEALAKVQRRSEERGESMHGMLTDVLAALQAEPRQTDAMLRQVLARLDEFPARPETDDELLKQVLAAVREQPAQVEAIVQEKLAALPRPAQEPDAVRELVEAVKTQSVQTEAQLQQLLARLDAANDAPHAELLTQLIREVQVQPARTEALLRTTLAQAAPAGPVELSEASLAALREAVSRVEPQTIDGQTQTLLRQVLAELRTTPEPVAAAVVESLRHELRMQIEQTLAAASRRDTAAAPDMIFPGIGPLASFEPASRAPSAPTAEPQLTETQRAYQRAFESGQVVTLGGGIDPTTGQHLPGRTLDPERAKALGLARWQDWYAIDDFQEQERLRKQATQFLASRTAEPLTTPLYQWAQQNSPGRTEIQANVVQRVVFLIEAGESAATMLPAMIERLDRLMGGLKPDDEFAVFFYQRDRLIEAPPRGLRPATPEARAALMHWLDPDRKHITPRGRANPTNALRRAMMLKPDQIYVLAAEPTGPHREQISHPQLLALVEELNKDRRVVINTVQFGHDDPQRTLELLATAYQGTYSYIPALEN